MSTERTLLDQIKTGPIPAHIAVIMDGNGRWAKKRSLPRIFGHRSGTQSVREIVRTCGELGVKFLTLYAFSTENWVRPQDEINGLMQLLSLMLKKEVADLHQKNVRLTTIGRTEMLPAKVRADLARAIKKLENNQGLTLNLALNYGGRQEMTDAVNKILAAGISKVEDDTLAQYLYQPQLPDPDLLIRTSGEQRISNFLIYQSAYSEFYFTKTLWPDFRKKDLYEAILDYQQRERRFGGTTSA